MEEDKILKDFDELGRSKKQGAGNSKAVLLFAGLVVVGAFIYAYSVTKSAFNKIIVVERSGEYLKISAESNEKLFVSLVKTTCAHLVHYANSFDRLTIRENQAKATMLCAKTDLQPIFNLYNQEKSYHEALERGVVYMCELEEVKSIGDTKPFHVVFTSILTITDGHRQTKFRIFSEGDLINVTPQFPENVTGFFFSNYKQTLKNITDE